MERILKIRAHHLLCLQGYQGFGYNKNFEANMNDLTGLLNNMPDLKFEVITAGDIICAYCPHCIDNVCCRDGHSAERIKDIDLKVLAGLDLKEKTIESASRLFSMVNDKFQKASELKDICGGCGWQEKCVWYQARLRI